MMNFAQHSGCRSPGQVFHDTRGRQPSPSLQKLAVNLGCPERLHIVGIGGAGMAPLAVLAMRDGWCVTGSDIRKNVNTELLTSMGVDIHIGHQARNISDGQHPRIVLATSAVPDEHVELRAAR